ncbi:hypothetical protein [Epilithonimonas sp. UC225_85]|uniref:hypothetical protein n=1 Tax=Epilithonimonas sp. UC225_85 TaxID=3350167 RepID=UPI0036D231F5
MGKDGAGLHVTQLQRSGGQWFALAIAHNFDYVICCGIKALGKLGKASEENVFFSCGGGILFKNAGGWLFHFIFLLYL